MTDDKGHGTLHLSQSPQPKEIREGGGGGASNVVALPPRNKSTERNMNIAAPVSGPADPKPSSPQPGSGPSSSGIDGSGRPPYDGAMEQRLAKLEGAYDSLKVVRPMTLAVLGVMLTVTIAGFALLGNQVTSLGTQMTSLRGEITSFRNEMAAGFSTMHTEMREDRAAFQAAVSAQVNAIANAVTATKQQAPQVILVPAPAVSSPNKP